MSYTSFVRVYLKIAILTLLTTLIVWLPFYLAVPELSGWGVSFETGMQAVWRNFDGPFYIIVSKTWYVKEAVRQTFSVPLPLEYYPAHLPFYPATISVLELLFNGPHAMLLSTLIGSILAFCMFFKYLSEFRLSRNPFGLTLVLMFLQARLLIARSIGAPETWFLFFILASLYCYKKDKYWGAAAFGALAQLTKSPAVLLFSFYKMQAGDFLAYFHSGDNFHLFWPPFSVFTPKGKFWTGDFWLEEVIWLWLIYGLTVAKLWKKKLYPESFFAGIYFASTLFVAHRDIARYSLPLAPMALIAWREVVSKKEFRWVLILLILPIFLYTWNFILNNQAPIPDWAPYL